MRRVAIAVSHANQEPYSSILEGFKRPNTFQFDEFTFDLYYFEGRQTRKWETWVRRKVEEIRYTPLWPILRVYDNLTLPISARKSLDVKVDSEKLEHKVLRINTPEDQRHIAIKVYAVAKFCQEKKYDFLIRTTSNSIINLSKVVSLIRESDSKELLYAGREVRAYQRPSFISGSFLVLNQKAIEFLLAMRHVHNYGVLDDVAIGKIFDNESIKVSKKTVKSVDFIDVQSAMDFPNEDFQEVMHYRCKANSNPRNDLEVMRALAQNLDRLGVAYV